jgi:hypothetical protein
MAEYVGDDPQRITDSLRRAFDSGMVVFSCGGIGATPDDHTRQCAGQALGLPLALQPQAKGFILERIRNDQDRQHVPLMSRVGLFHENLIEAAQATIVSAAARHESRGAHTVDDYSDSPEHPNGRNDAEWHKHTLWYSEGNRLSYKPVQMKPLTVDSVELKVRTF